MKKEFRIKKSQEIESIIKEKNSFGTAELVFYLKKTEETSHFRYAISVGKKIGNAVIRNHQKRRLRELVKIHQEKIPDNYLLFIVAKPKINNLSFSELEKQFLYLLRKTFKK